MHHICIKLTSMDAITITQNDFLDVLFTSRNKDYGAYSLRRQYERRMRNAVGITAALLVGLSAAYVVSNMMAAPHIASSRPTVIPTVLRPVDIPIEKPKVELPPPPARASAPAPSLPSVKNTVPVVVSNDVKDVDPPPTQDEMKNHVVSTVNAAGHDDGVDNDMVNGLAGGKGGSTDGKVITKEVESGPLTFVEQMPVFPGGDAALAKFLNNNIHYPSMAQENGIQGLVSVHFVVSATGSITDVQIIGAAKGGGLEEEALRVIKKMPAWKPGRQNGRNVAVYFTVPVNFRLAEQ